MTSRATGASIALLLSLLSTGVLRAEVSVDTTGSLTHTIIMGTVTEDTDPFGVWLQHRPIPANRVLNPEGHDRSDGRPDVAFRPNGFAVVVWAFNHGDQHDIAFSEWDGTGWTPTELLTNGGVDETDPSIFIEPDGSLLVTWWRNDLFADVLFRRRAAGTTTWEAATELTDPMTWGMRPSGVVTDGVTVAYEVTIGEFGLVVVADEAGSSFEYKAVAWVQTDQAPGIGWCYWHECDLDDWPGGEPPLIRLDAQMHYLNDRLWLCWKHGTEAIGFTEFVDGVWLEPQKVPWTDPTWVGVETMRKTIQNILAGQ